MKKSRNSDSQILVIIKQAESGVPISELCREHGMSSATFYRWRAKYGGMKEVVEDGVTGLVVELVYFLSQLFMLVVKLVLVLMAQLEFQNEQFKEGIKRYLLWMILVVALFHFKRKVLSKSFSKD